MRLRKLLKFSFILMMILVAVCVVFITVLNLPFSQRFATIKINQLLGQSQIPVHLDAIRKIMPGSLVVQGVVVTDTGKDTILLTGEVQADIRLTALLRKRVVVKDLQLDQAVVNLERKSGSVDLNIAAAFQSGEVKQHGDPEGKGAGWEITVKKGTLSGITFRMSDAVSGTEMEQQVSGAVINGFFISPEKRNLFCNSVEVHGAYGFIKQKHQQAPENKEQAAPWNLGLRNLTLRDIDFVFRQPETGLKLAAKVGDGSIRANQMDLSSGMADLKKIVLKDASVILDPGNGSGKPEARPDEAEVPIQWNISSGTLEVENASAQLGSEAGQIITDIDMNISDFKFSGNRAGMKVNKIDFDMGNGFSVQKVKGELDSDNSHTTVNMEIETGNSKLELEGYAEAALLHLVKYPGALGDASLDLGQTSLSIIDLSYFKPGLEDAPFYIPFSLSPFLVRGSFHLQDSVFTISEFSVSQHNNFKFGLGGTIDTPFSPSIATGQLDMELSGLDQFWLEDVVAATGAGITLPDLSDLLIRGHISDTLKSPELNFTLMSQYGTVGLEGVFNPGNERFRMGYSLLGVSLGELLQLPEMGSVTGTGEIKGAGFSAQRLNADFYFQLDTLVFRGYDYGETLLAGTISPGSYQLNVVARDSSLKGELNMQMEMTDSVLSAHASGNLMGQLRDLHLYEDSLNVGGSIEADLRMEGDQVNAELRAGEIIFTTPYESSEVRDLNAMFHADEANCSLHASADFFQVDIELSEPLNALDNIRTAYKNYISSFRDPSHITLEERVSDLPGISASVYLTRHHLLDLFTADSGIHFSSIDGMLHHPASENTLEASLMGEGIEYRIAKSGELHAVVTDSAGIINFILDAEKTSLNGGPENLLRIEGTAGNREILTNFSISDSLNRSVYLAEVSGTIDSSRFVLNIPGRQIILNRERWQMDEPDLLSIDLNNKMLTSEWRMYTDASSIHFITRAEDQLLNYRIDLDRVDLESLFRRDLFPGRPDGNFSGSIVYSTDRDLMKRVTAGLDIRDIRYSGHDISDIFLEGSYEKRSSIPYSIDLEAQMDSSSLQVTSEKNNEGERSIDASFSHFPMISLQPFIESYISELGGFISGYFKVSTLRGNEQADGDLFFEDGRLKVNILNNVFRIPSQHITLQNKKLIFNNFRILDTLDKALNIDGSVHLNTDGPITADLNVSSSKIQVMSRDENPDAPFTGNIFVNSSFSVKGPLSKPEVKGSIMLTKGTEIFYQQREDLRVSESSNIVNFVSHTQPGAEAAITPPVLKREGRYVNSSIATVVEIDPSTMIHFKLDKRMFHIDMEVKGGGKLQYNMLDNEKVTLSGRYEISDGSALLKLVGWPNKTFTIAGGGYIRWDGRVDNPELNFEAENRVLTSYINPVDNKRRDIEFNVILQISDYLSDLNVLFTIRTPDQYVMSVINSMSPEEQMRQALQVLLFETIDLPGITSSTDYMTQQVNQILASQLNQLTSSTIKGVDISFGVNSYDQSSAEGNTSSTSLSYEVKKSLLNNRATIEVSGRLHDVNQQPGASDNSLNNLSIEYRLDSAATKYLKVYNEHSYDDVFEGEVTKTGIGFTYRKRYSTFSDIWKRKK